MSNAFYNDMAQVAYDLLTEFGYPEEITITRDIATYDPTDGESDDEEELEGDFIMIKPPVNTGKKKPFDSGERSGTLIGEEQEFVVVAAKDAPFVPMKGDIIALPGGNRRASGVTNVSPAGIDICYKIGLES